MRNPQEYKFEYWFLNNKPKIKRIFLIFWICAISLLWIFLIVITIKYLTNIGKTNQIYADLAKNYVNYRAISIPKNLEISSESLLNSGNGEYAAFAIIKNPNLYWSASINYAFKINGEETAQYAAVIMPQKEIFATAFGLKSASPTADIELIFKNISWKNIHNRNALPALNIELIDAKYSIVSFDEADIDDSYSRVSAKILNKDIYGYKKIKVTILLLSQNTPQGTAIINLNNLLSGEAREIEFNWPRKYPFNPEIRYNIESDILDPNNLIISGD